MKKKEKGSALLVTLMVMVGLSLLGLGFISITETESAISVNQRNYTQTQAIAEGGTRLALEWFQDPNWANARGLLPPNNNALKIDRTIASGPGSPYTGKYRTSGLLFDKPFKGLPVNRFYGDEAHADVQITRGANATANTFLDTINTALFKDLTDGEITDIRVYAPPIIGGTLNGSGFWEGGNRYGVATIKVTAAKFRPGTNEQIAQRSVKLIISEWPFPGPQGPVQSNANISTSGNFGVHWGRMTSEGTLEIKRPLISIPWFDAWDFIWFERGYYGAGSDSNGDPNDALNYYKSQNWLYQLIGKGFEDPFYQARAKGDIVNAVAPNGVAHPFKYSSTAQDILNVPNVGWSNWFQYQDHNDPKPSDFQEVVFPKIDYEFWKNIAQAGAASSTNVHYLRWVAGENFTDGIDTKSFAQWVNTARAVDPAKPGFYFFDTRNGLNPQAGGGGVLTPDITVNASDDGNEFMMKGFIYLNASSFGTTGIRGPGGYFNFPGEPFRDVGYREVDRTLSPMAYKAAPPKDANNGQWDYQEINDNNRFDLFLTSVTVAKPDGSGNITMWRPVEWFPGCVPGWNNDAATPTANCSEPHEPYLNLIYPLNGTISQACCGGGGQPNDLVAGWENPTAQRKLPTKQTQVAVPSPIACVASAGPPDPGCTSNGYNKDGPLTQNFGNQPNTKPIMDGVLYNEGTFDTQGDAAYFGSILINGDINGTGTPEVWFDECLVKGCWQDKFTELPRVFVSAQETDQ